MLENYHTHTTRCGHAKGTEREYVERAIEGGLRVLGFSDHTPYPFADNRSDPKGMRMRPDELEGYVNTVLSLRREYAGQIEIRLGLETEYYEDTFDALLELLRPYPIEYMLLGHHHLGCERLHHYAGMPTEDGELLKMYGDEVKAGLRTGKFFYLAHPDLFNYVGTDRGLYDAVMRSVCETAKACAVPLEINCLGLTQSRNYPNPDFWRIAAEVGNAVVIGSDAHMPDGVVPGSIAQASALAARFGLTVQEHPVMPELKL